MEGWIDLGAFAAKYGVSQSTLRRRIRLKAIPFRMERGKYLLKDSDETLSVAPLFSRQPGKTEASTEAAPARRESTAATPARPKQPAAAPAQTFRAMPIAARAPAPQAAPTEPAPLPTLPDPIEAFLKSNEVVPVFLREDYERLLVENRRLREQVAELETLVKALEAQVGL